MNIFENVMSMFSKKIFVIFFIRHLWFNNFFFFFVMIQILFKSLLWIFLVGIIGMFRIIFVNNYSICFVCKIVSFYFRLFKQIWIQNFE